MSHLKRGVSAALAMVTTASMQLAWADIIDSYQPYVTTYGSTHTDLLDGGDVSQYYAYDTSTLDMSGGKMGHLTLNDSTAMSISGGSISHLNALESATVTVSGGVITFLRVHDDSIASITGPVDLSWLIVSKTSHIDIYAAEAAFSNGLLSGTWLDGSQFQFWTLIGEAGMPGSTPDALPTNITIHSLASVTSVPSPPR